MIISQRRHNEIFIKSASSIS